MRDLKALFELVRIPGVFTAHADILAGALLAGAGMKQFPDLALLLIATSCFFSAGMALNDYCDRNIDKLERPNRPIPSGRITHRAALTLGMALLATGIVLTILVNTVSLILALLMATAIVFYDCGLKRYPWIGPVNMGFCRYLNFLLGISILPLSPGNLLIPVLTWLYVFGITVLSSNEVYGRNNPAVFICFSCILGVGALYWLMGALEHLNGSRLGIYFCLLWMSAAIFVTLRLLFKTSPGDYQLAIKWLLLLLVMLDAAIVTGARSLACGVLVLALIFPGGYIAKRFYVT